MKIKWYGHASFKITTEKGVRIIIDPYESGIFGGAIAYGKVTDEADIVLTSHDHEDHNYIKDIQGKFKHINQAGTHEEKGVKIRAIPSYHDTSKGKERGENLIFIVDVDGLTVGHMGDLGHILEKDIVKQIGKVDVLLVPVGGFYTIDAKEATQTMNDLASLVTIPMHYKTEKCNLPIAGVEEFTKDKKAVRATGGSEVEITKANLPKSQEIVLLQYAL